VGYLFTLLANITEATITSVGAHLTTTLSGIFFLGIPAMISIGAYGMVVPQTFGYSLQESLVISFVLSLCASLLFVLFYLKLSKDSFTVFSLTTVLAVEAVVQSWDSVTGGVLGISGIMRPEYFSSFQDLVLLQVLVMFAVLIFEYILLKTWFGRMLLGLKESPEVVSSLKVSVARVGSLVIIISSILAAIEGVLITWRIQFLDASFGSIIVLIQILIIAIIAVKPRVYWLFLSVIFIVLLPEILRFLDIPPGIIGYVRDLLYSTILIIALFVVNNKYLENKRFI